MVEMDVGTGLMVLWEDALADLPGFIDRTLCQQDNHLAEFGIRALAYQIRYAHVGTELAFYFFRLDLDTSRADDIVFSSHNFKFLGRKLSDVVGDKGGGTNLGSIDHKTALVGKTKTNPKERGIKL